MEEINWTQDQMLEIGLKEPDDFLKVRETLSRVGVASRKEKKLYQSCHILHKQGRYFIVHFKELFALDGKNTNLSANDISRRNTITNLLKDWGLVNIISEIGEVAPLSQIKILSYAEYGMTDIVSFLYGMQRQYEIKSLLLLKSHQVLLTQFLASDPVSN